MPLAWPVLLVSLLAQQFPPTPVLDAPEADAVVIRQNLNDLNRRVAEIKIRQAGHKAIADIEICTKAADWITRHHEFFEPTYSKWTIEALETGNRRADEIEKGGPSWFPKAGSSVLAYTSKIDGSVQPYAVTLPRGYDPQSTRRWPLHVDLHGRNAKLNEVSFLHQYEGKPLKEELGWIQLDIFGRTNNAYRWAGEVDVFEALADLKRRVSIDDDRITLRGFSMGGAGTWHLGLHYPSLWSAIGAGAGFVDTVHHLSLKEPLSPLHEKMTKIYDAQDYALNAFNVPTIGYGGELDAQLFAGKTMHAKGKELGVSIELLIGPETAHKFHPESLKQFMAFLDQHSQKGRPSFPSPDKLKFVTYTLKYNKCNWLTIEEQIEPYGATIVEAEVDVKTRTLAVHTRNVAAFQIAPSVAEGVVIDGGVPVQISKPVGTENTAIRFIKDAGQWNLAKGDFAGQSPPTESVWSSLRKRHDLQGPIDDAFMEPFVCVRPTGSPWSNEQAAWAKWTLQRFEQEFDHRLRAKVPVVDDRDVTESMLKENHLVLFGDPGSNSLLAKVIGKLPIEWTQDRFVVAGNSYTAKDHGIAMIYPNPLNPRKYVVINSGHTFHEVDFIKSNANLYPRLGDVGVIQFGARPDGTFDESTVFADYFDSHWKYRAK